MDQKFTTKGVIIDLVCTLRGPVNSFTDISSIMVVYRGSGGQRVKSEARQGHTKVL